MFIFADLRYIARVRAVISKSFDPIYHGTEAFAVADAMCKYVRMVHMIIRYIDNVSRKGIFHVI